MCTGEVISQSHRSVKRAVTYLLAQPSPPTPSKHLLGHQKCGRCVSILAALTHTGEIRTAGDGAQLHVNCTAAPSEWLRGSLAKPEQLAILASAEGKEGLPKVHEPVSSPGGEGKSPYSGLSEGGGQPHNRREPRQLRQALRGELVWPLLDQL